MPKKITKKTSRSNLKSSSVVETLPSAPKQTSRTKKILVGILLALPLLWLLSFIYVVYVASATINPVLQRFEKYSTLENWDSRRHMTDTDIDGDGQRDIVTFTGCVVLSSMSQEMIPGDKQCTADYIVPMAGLQNGSVGQKYTSQPGRELELLTRPALISYSYVGKVKNGPWQIYSKEQNQPLKMYQFNDQNILEEQPVPWQAKVDYYFIYQLGKIFFFFITLPLYLLGRLVSFS